MESFNHKRNRLYGSRTYLIGAMDRVADNGIGWRKDITPFLTNRGIVVLDPCNKPINIGLERIEDKEYRRRLKAEGNYDELAKAVKLLRIVDLRMVDISDFIICNLDINIHATGTYEEMFWANRLKRPIIIRCEQGKQNIPDWLFSIINHNFFFSTWDEVKEYIRHIDEDEHVEHRKRWMFFDYNRLVPTPKYEYVGPFDIIVRVDELNKNKDVLKDMFHG